MILHFVSFKLHLGDRFNSFCISNKILTRAFLIKKYVQNKIVENRSKYYASYALIQEDFDPEVPRLDNKIIKINVD